MIKSIYFPDKEYSTKEELFKDLKDNLAFITDAKKSQIQKSCEKGISVTCKSLDLLKFEDQLKGIKIDDNFYYVAVNSTRILDSHEDLHLDNLWNKSIKDQQGKNYLVIDHELEVDKVVVRKEHIEMFTAKIPFALLGKPYAGDTQALIYKFPKAQVKHQLVKEWLESGDDIEASVRMQYVTFVLCLDSNDPEDATLKANYDQYLPLIANKEDFEYISYFFAIKEAKNIRESSLVIFGSNSTTGQINNKQAEQKEYKAMAMASNKNKDVEFIDMMIPHHEKAIEMANEYKKEIIDKDLKAIVDNIKSSQTDEINKMKAIKNKIQADKSLENIEEPSKDTQKIEVEKELLKELLNKF